MWLNEDEINEAAGRYRVHPVLGPATRTLASLVEWTNANSDGWPYWRQPAKAADKLMTLIGTGVAYGIDPDRQDATPDAYRVALRPLKAFRTRVLNGSYGERLATGLDPGFVIIEPGPAVGGEVWAASQAVEDARRAVEDQRRILAAAQRVLDYAQDELLAVQRRANLAAVRAEADAGLYDDDRSNMGRLARFDVGDLLWVLPQPGEPGLGMVGVVTGLEYRTVGAVLTWLSPDGRHGGGEYRPMSLAAGRAAHWIVTRDRSGVVGGGWADPARTAQAQSSRFPGCVMVSGTEFMPDPATLTSTPAEV